MRPVLLELDGFASFREPTVVDFRDADYFALVGPTGSGKSTVIDALTFALYGSVPRWDNPRTVALALAPTVGRGVVRFVFDVGRGGGAARGTSGAAGGDRYVVVRELRRAATGGVSVRSARLERLRDPSGTGAPDEETEPLAEGAPATTRAVEALLGLPFSDFTTCVVLPQGEFAEFLHTEPRKRQETLVRLLGLGVYDVIAKEANTDAKLAEQRAQVLTEQLGGYGDATADAEQAAARRVEELARLRKRVEAAGVELDAVDGALAEVESLVDALNGEQRLLSGLAPPSGLAALTVRHGDAVAASARATTGAHAAEAADSAAREALDAAPPRAPLEQAGRDHAERLAVAAALPEARERHARARVAEQEAAAAAGVARVAVEAARELRDTATDHLADLREISARLGSERDLLQGVAAPAGLDALGDRVATTSSALAAALDAVEQAEKLDDAARSALAAAPVRAPLEQARRDHEALGVAQAALTRAITVAGAARAAAATAAGRVSSARAHTDHARERRAASARRDLAAALRPALVVGDACPVCAARVSVLPDPLPAGDLAGADREWAAAEAALEAARQAEAAANADAARADDAVAAAQDTVERLTNALAAVAPGVVRNPVVGGRAPVVGAAAIEAALARLDDLDGSAREADAAARRARTTRDQAVRAAEAARRDTATAAAALRATRDPLVPLGAPAVDDGHIDGGIARAWTALVAWAGDTAADRSAALISAAADVERSAAAQAAAQDSFVASEHEADRRRRAETAAARREQDAAGAVDRLEHGHGELVTALRGAPDPSVVSAELLRIDELEDAVRAAGAGVRAARVALRAAEQATAAVERELREAWDGLRAARDPLVVLGAPALRGDDIEVAWAGLLQWAAGQAEERSTRLGVVRSQRTGQRGRRADLVARIVGDLADHGVTRLADARPGPVSGSSQPSGSGLAPAGSSEPGPVDVAGAPAAVAAALERAHATRERITERRATAAALLDDRDRAVEGQRVARMLGQLLRSDGFPRWLVASALDALVADASVSLAELSGGQFELTHENGEFLVVDHTDADTRRPVKTLSGGETFQASLALALALSAQMSGLAAHGAARLESIFLDEGFGTLDAANLETVASTLETLAARGDRVVGVVTHVPALAERVPVRYVVRRDHATSSVTREDL